MFHSWDSPRLLVCDTGLYLEQNDISFITVAICGGYISKYPRLCWHSSLTHMCVMELQCVDHLPGFIILWSSSKQSSLVCPGEMIPCPTMTSYVSTTQNVEMTFPSISSWGYWWWHETNFDMNWIMKICIIYSTISLCKFPPNPRAVSTVVLNFSLAGRYF